MTTGRPTNKLAKFVQLNAADKWLFCRAVGWLAVARLRLATMPFARLAEKLSANYTLGDHDAEPELLGRIGIAVRRAANNVPWRSDCFPQTIAAQEILARYGYASTIHLGVEKPEEDTIAGHAWLTCGETVVTGGEVLDRYSEVHRF